MKTRWLAALLMAGALSTTTLGARADAQTRAVARHAPVETRPTLLMVDMEDAGTRQAMYNVRGDLRQLVMAQEAFWRARHIYASDVSFLPMFHPTPGIAVQIVQAHPDGWTARAAYPDGMGNSRSCAIWVGEIAAADRPVTDLEHKVYPEAEVSCDGDGYASQTEWVAAGHSYMTYALHKLVQSEARFYAFHHRFAKDPAALDPFIWDRDVAVTITAATPTGWAARASFAATPGQDCVIWHGTLATADLPAPGTQENEVRCR